MLFWTLTLLLLRSVRQSTQKMVTCKVGGSFCSAVLKNTIDTNGCIQGLADCPLWNSPNYDKPNSGTRIHLAQVHLFARPPESRYGPKKYFEGCLYSLRTNNYAPEYHTKELSALVLIWTTFYAKTHYCMSATLSSVKFILTKIKIRFRTFPSALKPFIAQLMRRMWRAGRGTVSTEHPQDFGGNAVIQQVGDDYSVEINIGCACTCASTKWNASRMVYREGQRKGNSWIEGQGRRTHAK